MDGQHGRRAYADLGDAAKKLIQAAVDCVSDPQATPPPELRLYWMCMRYGSLPEPGGLLDQDAGLMGRMSLLGNVYDTVQRVRGLVGDQIHDMRPEDGRLLAWLDRIGVRV